VDELICTFLFWILSHFLSSKPSDWYSITRAQIVQVGGRGLVNHFASPAEAIMATYPEIAWEPSKFVSVSQHRTDLSETGQESDILLEELKVVEEKLGIKDVHFLLTFFPLHF
jgi:hypothetical protein